MKNHVKRASRRWTLQRKRESLKRWPVEFSLVVEGLRLRRRERSSSAMRASRLRNALRLQEEDLAFEIGEARGLRGLDTFEILKSLEAGQKFFEIRWASVEQGFDTREAIVH